MNKKALITGASRGIGKALAYAFAKEGYDLYLTCLSSISMLEQLSNELATTFHIKCISFQIDASNYDEVSYMFSKIDSLDILINNAGISHMGLLSELTLTEWHQIINTNLSACFYTSKLAIPLFLKNHSGKIINISSVWGNVGASMEVAYSASKGGMNSFTKALAKELAPSNIQVNAIACGLIETDMNQTISPEELSLLCNEIPADRIGEPAEVAHLALMLSTSPSYLTGQIITLDGGWI